MTGTIRSLATALGLGAVLVACQGSELQRPLDQVDVVTDTTEDTSNDTADAVESSLRWWFVTEGGTKCVDEATCELVREDEPAAYADVPGFQIEVQVEMVGVSPGTDVALTVDGNIVAQGVSTFGGGGTTGVRFTNVTIPADGEVTVTVSSTDATGASLSESKVVTTSFAPCALTVTTLLDAETSCVQLGVADGGGIEIPVTVHHTGAVCETAALSFTYAGTTTDFQALPFDDNGDAVFVIAFGAGAELEGDLRVVATAAHPTVENLSGEVEATWTVDNVAPVVTLTSPAADGGILPSDDVDAATDGLQYDVTGDIDDDNASLELRIDGALTGEAGESEPGTFTFAAVTLANDGVTEFRVTAHDGCGNEGEAVVSVPVTTTPAQVEITEPTDGATLLAVDDRDPATASIYELDVTVSAPTAGDGDSIVVECGTAATPPTFTEVGAAAVDAETLPEDGLYAIAVTLDVGAFGSEILCRARIASAANPGTSEVIALTVALPAPTLDTLTAPTPAACLTSDSWTVGGPAAGLDGQDVTVTVSVGASQQLTATGGPVTDGSYEVAVDVSALEDGAYDISVDATDAWGNVVSDTQSLPEVSVVRDTTAPVIVLTSPTGAINPNAIPDQDPATAGYQTTVTLRMNDANAVGGELCLSVGGADQGCKTLAAGSLSVSWTGVTLVEGDNVLTGTGSDVCGNPAETLTSTVTVTAFAPTVAITEPAEDFMTADATATLVATVTAADGTTPVSGAAVTLLNGGTDTGASATDNGDGSYTFADVALADGANSFTVAATVSGASATSTPRVIVRKTATPTIALTVPAAGTYNLASTECQAGSVDCVLDATATTTDAEDGSAAQLAVDCGAGATTYDAVVSGGAATFGAVALANGTCTLTPSVTDVVAQSATGAAVVVTVDRVAPTVQITSPAGSQLVFNQDADPGTAGIQYALTAVVKGVEAGQAVTATLVHIDPTNATTTVTLTHTVATDTGDAESYTASFEDVVGAGTVTFLDGSYAITVTVSDAAGNPATPATKNLAVQSEEAYVRVTFPSYLAPVACDASTPCPSGRTCNVDAGLCYDNWQIDEVHNVVTTTAGVQTTSDNLRICSNHPSLAGSGAAACTTDLGDGTTFYELVLTDTTGGPNATDIGAVVPEGFQTIVAEMLPVAGGLWLSSEAPGNAVTERDRLLYVDLTRPVVSALGSPSDVLEPFNVLNSAEQVALGRVFDIGFDASEAGSATVFINGVADGTTQVSAGTVKVQAPLASGANTIYVVLTDAVGNQSLAPPSPGVVLYTPTVDVIAPTLNFVTPASSPLGADDNLDVTVSSDAEGRTVTLVDSGTTVGTAVVTGGIASFPHATFGTLSDGTHALTASVSDAAGNVTLATTTPEQIIVDTVAPTGTIDAPATGTIFTDADDAAPGTTGFQIAVDFSTSDAVSWSLWTASNCDVTFTTCDAPVVKKSGTVTNPGGSEPQQLVTIDLSAATTRKQLILEVVDDTGNTATTSVDLTFVVANCTLVFDDVPASDWYNATVCANGVSCATADVTVSVSQVGACVGINRVQLLDGATVLGTDGSPGLTSTFTVTLSDGATLALEAKAFTGNTEVASSGVRDVRTDFTPPDVTFVGATVDGFATPAENAALVWNTELDHAPLTPGFQFHARVQVADANVSGGAILSVAAAGSDGPVALTPSNASFPVAITGTSPVSRDLLDMTLADLDTHVVTVTATDAAGNPGTSAFTAQVDVTRPDPVVITGVTVISKRRVRSAVNFTAVGDNGMAGGAVARYDMRYSRSPITDENFESACNFRDLYITRLVPTPAAPGTVQSGQVGGPDKRPYSDPCKLSMTFDDGVSAPSDPLWYYAVRAEDAAGNVSLLGVSSVAIQTRAQMQLDVDRIVFSNDAGSAFAGKAVFFPFRGGAIGDVNDDGVMDLATGSELASGFCVLYGHTPAAEEVLTTASGANHDCILDPTTLFTGATPRSTAALIKGLGDINGDGIDDFGVTGRFGSGGNYTGEGFVLIYLGRTGGPDLANPEVVIRGLQHVGGVQGAPNIALCGVGDFDGLDDGGGVADDLGVGEPAYNRFHVIPGRTSWTPGQARVTIDMLFDTDSNPANGEPDDSAVRVANGIFSVYAPSFTTGTGLFGAQCGEAGDLLPTPAGGGSGSKSDAVVWQSGSDDSRLFVFPGREYTPGTIVQVSQNLNATDPLYPTAEDAISLRLRQEASNVKVGFGAAFLTKVDVTGDFVPDVVAGCRQRSAEIGGDGKSAYIFDGAKLASLAGTDVRVDIGTNPKIESSWKGANGFVLDVSVNSEPGAIGNVGNLDELYLESPPVPGNDLMFGSAVYDRLRLRCEQRVPGLIDYGLFPVQDAELSDIFGVQNSAIGTWISGGFDLDRDTKLDFVTGGAGGQVLIVH